MEGIKHCFPVPCFRFLRPFCETSQHNAERFELPGKASGVSAGRDVGEIGIIGKHGNKLVPAFGEGGGDAGFCIWESGQKQKPAVGQGFLPLGRNALRQRTCGADDDGLGSAQKNAQALLLNG